MEQCPEILASHLNFFTTRQKTRYCLFWKGLPCSCAADIQPKYVLALQFFPFRHLRLFFI